MSYSKIFTVVTEHTASTVTSRYAVSMAAGCKADLVLYSAHDVTDNKTVLQRIDNHLDQLYAAAVKLGINVTRITETGNINILLPGRVQSEQADLVFYTMAPHEHYGANLRRHTVSQLQRLIKADLAIMRVTTMVMPHPAHILVPLGKAVEDSERRLVFVTWLAKSFHSQITLFHLSEERIIKDMPEGIMRFRDQLIEQHVSVKERKGTGYSGNSIAVEAITHHDDLIVLGASERGVFRRLLFGNPAGEVMYHPPCNTILFRAAR